MASKMLIDATHAEETRVVVVDGQRIEEFDFESINRKQLAGNIYLAKVMRVEPSLQAAFVDYGGNRHGFLAFSEIHPDYYQIPAEERAALIASYQRAAKSDDDDSSGDSAAATEAPEENSDRGGRARRTRGGKRSARRGAKPRRSSGGATRKRTGDGFLVEREFRISGGVRVRLIDETDRADPKLLEQELVLDDGTRVRLSKLDQSSEEDDEGPVRDAMAASADVVERVSEEVEEPEAVGGGDSWDDEPAPRPRLRDYKIQDVIKRRQILLIQIVKEERGTKGAAVTTYLSLPGRYCVLMPNTAKGGGISRKITNAGDRKRLKEIAGEMEVPKGMGLIVRTAGAQRTKAEIKRDYEYLLRQWDSIRTLTLESFAPALIYEEGSLIKRSIRDLYSKEISEVLVEGEAGYREAKDYMKMLMPSHAKHVQHYNDRTPLFIRFQVENQLSAMFNPVVQLKSGGYIVIGITEALVAIDVNSGRSTRESSIEETAAKTNLEAAEEAARQMRLRDLAGLIVIDFIDMYERRNNAAVERKLKDKLSTDRARIQVGRISSFGLLEMSRQRLRPGMLEATTTPCAHCHGTGLVRSEDTMALAVLRDIEEACLRGNVAVVTIAAPVAVANFLLNRKRDRVVEIERRYGVRVLIEGDPTRIGVDYELGTLKPEETPDDLKPAPVVQIESGFSEIDDDDAEEDAEEDEVEDAEILEETPPKAAAKPVPDEAEDDDRRSRGGKRRGRRGGKRSRKQDDASDPLAVIDVGEQREGDDAPFNYSSESPDKNGRDTNRRSRRGGRGRKRRNDTPREFSESAAFSMLRGNDALDRALPNLFIDSEIVFDAAASAAPEVDAAQPASNGHDGADPVSAEPEVTETAAAPEPEVAETVPAPEAEAAEQDAPVQADAEAAQASAEQDEVQTEVEMAEDAAAEIAIAAEPALDMTPPPPPSPPKPKRRGWWSA